MAQPNTGDSVPTPDPVIVKRLGYIKLLHGQAVEQSYLPAPFNFVSLLALHDVLEYFVILCIQHADPAIDLSQPLSANLRKVKAPDGGLLSCRDALERISVDRNKFKHQGNIPGFDQIENARHDAERFLTANCIRVFGAEYADISMLHIVPQQTVRERLQASRASADAGQIAEAMADVAIAFHELVDSWGSGKRVSNSSSKRASLVFNAEEARIGRRKRLDVYMKPRDGDTASAFSQMLVETRRAFEEMDQEVEALRHVMRLQVAGIDMARYVRFDMLTPEANVYFGGKVEAHHRSGQYHYTSENYDFCESFVIDSALRLVATDFAIWTPETFGDAARADEAMKANGGPLPDGWGVESP